MYCAYITTLKGLRKHSNADRLQCVEVFGQNVIVDLSYQEGQKVIFFPSDGQLSLEYATDNNLVRKKDENGNNIGGYMDAEKRNVTAIRLRGEKSEGLVLPIETLAKYTDISKLKDGDQITVLGGHEICQKYITRGKSRSKNNGNNSNKKNKFQKETISYPFFEEHKDTAQLAYNMSAFKPGDTIYITRKLHGTSARTMKTVKVTKKNSKLRKFLHMQPKVTREVSVVSGSRRVVLKDMTKNDGYYSDNGFRKKYHDLLKDKLPEGARDYYNAAIREKEEFYNKASATYAEISGKRDTAEKDLYQANKDIMRVTQQINACLDENKEDEAMQYAMKKSTLENKINVLKETIEEMKEAQAHQKDIRDQAAEELQKLKEEKEQVLFQMEADSQIIELHQSMDSLNTNNESDRMLERVREGARKTRERAEGSRIAYDSSAQANERRLANSERERNARQILDDMKRQRGNK